MPDVIRLLPDAIANQIAAGEVIQRPASAVKELLENAIDAGSTNIQLIIKNAGKTLIQVIDNGCGMSETDARLCFERHATSKIRQANDLFDIRTLGFRGEAMASIAAVAQVELKTRPKNQDIGTRILVEGSTVTSQEVCQTPQGTSLAIKNLFYNIPARRNFLKSNPVETRHIVDEFQRVALANPKIAFSFHNNNVEVFRLPSANLRRRIVALFGHNVNEKLIPIEEETNFLRIYGFIGKAQYARKTRGEQYFFVNERFIKSSYLNHAVIKGYEELLPEKNYPLYVIFVDIDPSRIDVNVHPTKQEIKFDDEKVVYTFINAAVKRALGTYTLTPTLDFEQDVNWGFMREQRAQTTPQTKVVPTKNVQQTPKINQKEPPQVTRVQNAESKPLTKHKTTGTPKEQKQKWQIDKKGQKNWEELYRTEEVMPTERQPTLPPKQEPKTITIESSLKSKAGGIGKGQVDKEGQLHETVPYQLHRRYIVAPIKSGYILVDQQAAHERILYEKYLNKLEDTKAITQQLLFPQTIELPRADAVILSDILSDIQALGYDIQTFGRNTFVIHGVPSDVGSAGDEQQLIESLIEQYKLNLTTLKLDKRSNLLRTMAVNKAIKTGQKLTVEEMRRLLDELFACTMPYAAPNGRLTFIKYNLTNIEKQFKQKKG